MFTDEQLAEQIQEGDQRALADIIERYQQKLFFYTLRMVGSEDEADDVVQETFLKAYQNINSFDVSRKFSSWIYRIAHNQAVNAVKKKNRVKLVEVVNLDWYMEHETEVLDFIESEERKELSEDLLLLLENLRPDYKEVVLLYYFENKSYDEISDIMQIPKTTVGVWLNRAKEQLKKKITPYDRNKKD